MRRRELVEQVRNGEIHPRELVTRSIEQIERLDGELNTVVARDFERALKAAESHDRNGALAGLPFLVKDLQDAQGLITTNGSPAFAKSAPATTDSTVVARMKAQGAIVVGKSNTPEFGHTAYTTNRVFGPTFNPWNKAFAPGGSSGGSAAALAAGLVPLATTSDGGGSVRLPASLCGMVGYKPSNGALGTDGAARWLNYSTWGATAPSVDDVILEAEVILGGTKSDIHSVPRRAVNVQPTRPYKVVACPTLRAGVDPEIRAAFEASLAAIEAAGIPVELVDEVFSEDVATGWFITAAAELVQSLAGEREALGEMEPSLSMMFDVATQTTLDQYIEFQRLRFRAYEEVETLLDSTAVLLTPTVNVVGWGPEGPLPVELPGGIWDPGLAVNTPDFNFTGHPGVSVPMGISREGVPMGLQIVAPKFEDQLALGLAKVVEEARPWPLVASGYQAF